MEKKSIQERCPLGHDMSRDLNEMSSETMGLAGKESDSDTGDSKCKDVRQEALLCVEGAAKSTEW